jgi:hypothetical protein
MNHIEITQLHFQKKNKEKQMGRKGVSKRKPKKSKLVPVADSGGSSNGRSPVQLLVDKSAPVNRDGMKNPSAGSNKAQKKR